MGSLLRVPFGGRRALGVVVGMAGVPSWPRRLADPRRCWPLDSRDLVALAEWMAREYCSTAGAGVLAGARAGHRRGRAGQRSWCRADPRRARAPAVSRRGHDRQRALLEALRDAGPTWPPSSARRRCGGWRAGPGDPGRRGNAAPSGRPSARMPRARPRADRGPADVAILDQVLGGPALTAIRERSTGARGASFCTGSPGRGRPRVPRRGRRRPGLGARRSCSFPRSGSRPRPWGVSKPGSDPWWRCCTRALARGSAMTSGSACARLGAGLRGTPLGRVRPARRRRPDRGRRRARLLLQARGRPALRRSRRWRCGAGQRAAGGAARLNGSATPRPESIRQPFSSLRLPDRVDRRPLPTWRSWT